MKRLPSWTVGSVCTPASSELLTSAGYWPAVFIALGPTDPTLERVAGKLLQERSNPERAERLRRAIGGLLDLLPAGG